MGIKVIDDTHLKNIANAIRDKKGDVETYKPSEMASAILEIETGGGGIVPSGTINITENGSHDVTNYATANVNVVSSSEGDMLQARVDSINSCKYMFYYYAGTNLDFINALDTSKVTDMSYMFKECSSVTSIGHIDFSSATNMLQAFYNCKKLVSLPPMYTSKATNMKEMLYNCWALENIDVLNTSSVTNLDYTFYYCSKLKSLPKLNTDKVTSFNDTFYNCQNLETIDLSKFNITNVSKCQYAFKQCYNLKNLVIRNATAVPVINTNAFDSCHHFKGTVHSTFNPEGLRDGKIYVPDNLVETWKTSGNWVEYADLIYPLSEYVE